MFKLLGHRPLLATCPVNHRSRRSFICPGDCLTTDRHHLAPGITMVLTMFGKWWTIKPHITVLLYPWPYWDASRGFRPGTLKCSMAAVHQRPYNVTLYMLKYINRMVFVHMYGLLWSSLHTVCTYREPMLPSPTFTIHL